MSAPSPSPGPSTSPPAIPPAIPSAIPSAGLLPVLRTELRRGRFLWWWAALVAVQLAGLYVYRWVWQESWADLAQYVRNLAFLTGPLLAALAARHGGRDRRLGTAQLAASVPRSRLQRTVAGLLPVLVCGTAAYLTVWLVTVAAAWPSASAYGRPLFGPAAGDLGAVALFASAGYVLGRLAGGPLLAPLAAVCGYAVLLVWNVPHSSGWAQLVPVTFERHEGRLPAWWTGPAQLAWFGGLAVTLVLVAAARRRWAAVVPLVVAVAGAVPLQVAAADGVWRPDPDADRLVCGGDSPELCMRAGHEGRRDEVAGYVRRAAELLENVPGAPVRFEEASVSWSGSAAGPKTAVFQLVDGPGESWESSERNVEGMRRDAVLRPLLGWGCSEDVPTWSEGVLRWAHGRLPGGGGDAASMGYVSEADPAAAAKVAAALERMDGAERREWLGDYLAARDACDPSAVDVP
ncbi:hypothetical protein GCM10010406_04810 [Streptomyces thermolineatus]|uniref:ABC transporter permease n=1 Tax=Streptomyces thermolineatus TaxID=44033 RepID=A0ABN3KUF8_9ACTN